MEQNEKLDRAWQRYMNALAVARANLNQALAEARRNYSNAVHQAREEYHRVREPEEVLC